MERSLLSLCSTRACGTVKCPASQNSQISRHQSHTQNITEHTVPGNLTFHPLNTRHSKFNEAVLRSTSNGENEAGLQMPPQVSTAPRDNEAESFPWHPCSHAESLLGSGREGEKAAVFTLRLTNGSVWDSSFK